MLHTPQSVTCVQFSYPYTGKASVEACLPDLLAPEPYDIVDEETGVVLAVDAVNHHLLSSGGGGD